MSTLRIIVTFSILIVQTLTWAKFPPSEVSINQKNSERQSDLILNRAETVFILAEIERYLSEVEFSAPASQVGSYISNLFDRNQITPNELVTHLVYYKIISKKEADRLLSIDYDRETLEQISNFGDIYILAHKDVELSGPWIVAGVIAFWAVVFVGGYQLLSNPKVNIHHSTNGSFMTDRFNPPNRIGWGGVAE